MTRDAGDEVATPELGSVDVGHHLYHPSRHCFRGLVSSSRWCCRARGSTTHERRGDLHQCYGRLHEVGLHALQDRDVLVELFRCLPGAGACAQPIGTRPTCGSPGPAPARTLSLPRMVLTSRSFPLPFCIKADFARRTTRSARLRTRLGVNGLPHVRGRPARHDCCVTRSGSEAPRRGLPSTNASKVSKLRVSAGGPVNRKHTTTGTQSAHSYGGAGATRYWRDPF